MVIFAHLHRTGAADAAIQGEVTQDGQGESEACGGGGVAIHPREAEMGRIQGASEQGGGLAGSADGDRG